MGTGRELKEVATDTTLFIKKPLDFPRVLAPLAGTEPVQFFKGGRGRLRIQPYIQLVNSKIGTLLPLTLGLEELVDAQR